jgi:hypothetical protein
MAPSLGKIRQRRRYHLSDLDLDEPAEKAFQRKREESNEESDSGIARHNQTAKGDGEGGLAVLKAFLSMNRICTVYPSMF